MTTTTVTPTAAVAATAAVASPGGPALPMGPIMVGSDGTAAGGAACRAGRMLADRTGTEVCVVGVVEPIPTISAEVAVAPVPAEAEAAMRAELREQIVLQIAATGDSREWPVEVRHGAPALTIATRAHELHARAIVLGLGRHQLPNRIFGTETALQVLRLADVPVLAVPPTFTQLPRRALVAVDFSAVSLRAARLAVALFPDLITLDLVHVTAPLGPAVVATPWDSEYGVRLKEAWQGFIQALALPTASPVVQELTVKGRAAEALLSHAAEVGADLIVVGSHGRGFIERMIVGSVATRILRGAQVSVLAVPIVQ